MPNIQISWPGQKEIRIFDIAIGKGIVGQLATCQLPKDGKDYLWVIPHPEENGKYGRIAGLVMLDAFRMTRGKPSTGLGVRIEPLGTGEVEMAWTDAIVQVDSETVDLPSGTKTATIRCNCPEKPPYRILVAKH
jgi:hypothetical protein